MVSSIDGMYLGSDCGPAQSTDSAFKYLVLALNGIPYRYAAERYIDRYTLILPISAHVRGEQDALDIASFRTIWASVVLS